MLVPQHQHLAGEEGVGDIVEGRVRERPGNIDA